MRLDIILRTCDKVYTVHDSSDGVNKRIAGTTKLDVMIRCISSLITSMNVVSNSLRLIIIDDNSSDKGLRLLNELVNKCKHYHEIILMSETGNGASLKVCYDWALRNGRDYFYFVEDDYLHDIMCISEMICEHGVFKENLNHEVALFPYDNIDNYRHSHKNNVPCFMALGENRHWRTTTCSTSTFLCSKEILEIYWYLFERMTHYGEDPTVCEDNTINKIWEAPYKGAGGAYLLSPIPSLSLHFHFKDHLAPYIDWKKWWEQSDPMI